MTPEQLDTTYYLEYIYRGGDQKLLILSGQGIARLARDRFFQGYLETPENVAPHPHWGLTRLLEALFSEIDVIALDCTPRSNRILKSGAQSERLLKRISMVKKS